MKEQGLKLELKFTVSEVSYCVGDSQAKSLAIWESESQKTLDQLSPP